MSDNSVLARKGNVEKKFSAHAWKLIKGMDGSHDGWVEIAQPVKAPFVPKEIKSNTQNPPAAKAKAPKAPKAPAANPTPAPSAELKDMNAEINGPASPTGESANPTPAPKAPKAPKAKAAPAKK